MSESVLVELPTAQTVAFAGRFVNLSALGRTNNIDTSTVSKIFRGTRQPTLQQCLKISKALSMTVEQFLDRLKEHQRLYAIYGPSFPAEVIAAQQ